MIWKSVQKMLLHVPSLNNEEKAKASPDELIGRAVQKQFDADMFTGRVVSYDAKLKWFRILYSDGDAEEVRIDDLEPLLTEDTDVVAVTEQPALSAADLSVGAPSTPATEVPVLSPYEQQRLANIRLNQAKLASLGLAEDAALPSSSSAALMLQPPVSDCLHSTSED